MGRQVRAWLIVVFVLAAAVLTASIQPVSSERAPVTRVRFRIDAENVLFLVHAGREERLLRLPTPLLGDDWDVVKDRLLAILRPGSPGDVFYRQGVTLEIEAPRDVPWMHVARVMATGGLPDVRLIRFDLVLAGTSERLTWTDSTNDMMRTLMSTPMEDVIEVRLECTLDSSGLTTALFVYEDGVAPFMLGWSLDGEVRPRRRLAGLDQSDWERALADGVLRVLDPEQDWFRVGLAFSSVPEEALPFGAMFDVLRELDRLGPFEIFLAMAARE